MNSVTRPEQLLTVADPLRTVPAMTLAEYMKNISSRTRTWLTAWASLRVTASRLRRHKIAPSLKLLTKVVRASRGHVTPKIF